MAIPLAELCTLLEGKLHGGAGQSVQSIAPLDRAGPGDLSFLANPRYAANLAATRATAVLLQAAQVAQCPVACIEVDNPYLAYARASALFDDRPVPNRQVHTTATVADSAKLGENVTIGPHCVVEEGAVIGADTVLGPNSVVGAGTVIGLRCRLAAGVVLYHGITLGDEVEVHSGSVIGADGFGFAPAPSGWQKIYQLGSVRIGNRVSIGANSTIDRGAISDTVIADGVIIDNLVQIAHNVVIGENTALAGCVGIAGSATIGANCTIGGGVGIAGHLTVCDNVHLTGMTLVSKSITEAGTYSSGTALSTTARWRKNAVRFLQLDALHRRVSRLEKRLD